MEGAMRIARGYARRKMPSYSLADTCDLEQSVCIGLLQAVDAFDPNYGTTFMQFANMPGHSRIFGSVIDCLRKLQDYPRSIAALRRRVRPLMAHLRQVLRHEPTIEEFCDYYGEQYRELVENPLVNTSVFNQTHSYTGGEEGEEENSDMGQGVEDHRDQDKRHGNLATPEAVENSNRILDVIDDKDIRFVIWAYYYMGFINEAIAEFLDCSTSSVAKKHRRGLEILKQKFSLVEFRDLVAKRK
jgi:RNA polymerase sigma factor (sigma-70 family)